MERTTLFENNTKHVLFDVYIVCDCHTTKLTVRMNIHCCTYLDFLGNLTGHDEKVGPENFELLKVLGTGGTMLFKVFCSINSSITIIELYSIYMQ